MCNHYIDVHAIHYLDFPASNPNDSCERHSLPYYMQGPAGFHDDLNFWQFLILQLLGLE